MEDDDDQIGISSPLGPSQANAKQVMISWFARNSRQCSRDKTRNKFVIFEKVKNRLRNCSTRKNKFICLDERMWIECWKMILLELNMNYTRSRLSFCRLGEWESSSRSHWPMCQVYIFGPNRTSWHLQFFETVNAILASYELIGFPFFFTGRNSGEDKKKRI